MRKFLSLIALAALPLTAADAGVISINLTDGGPGAGFPSATNIAGVIDAPYWNTAGGSTLPGVAGTNTGNLKDDSGANSGVSMSNSGGFGGWYALGVSGYNGGADNQSNKVMENFAIVGAAGASITFSNISYANYDVYIFSARNNSGVAVSKFTIGSDSEYIWGKRQTGDFIEGDYASAAAAEAAGGTAANYVRFEGLTGSSFTIDIAAIAGATGGNSAIINGIQIVETQGVPEPGTMTLAGLGALCMLRRRRH